MDLLSWIRAPDPSVEILYGTELGDRLRQIIEATSDYSLLFSYPDFVSLLAQYTCIQSLQLNVPATILISEEFIIDDVSYLSKFGINYKFFPQNERSANKFQGRRIRQGKIQS